MNTCLHIESNEYLQHIIKNLSIETDGSEQTVSTLFDTQPVIEQYGLFQSLGQVWFGTKVS